MKQNLRFILSCIMALFLIQAHAQDRTISGTVTEAETGLPLPGVNIIVKGTAIGTSSDADGNYTLNVSNADATLVFTFIGLITQEVSIANRTIIDVAMAADATQLSEVIITGYGERTANSYTGSAAVLSGEKFRDISVASPDQVLQGNIAGLQLAATSGVPGSNQDILIRGVSSINASNAPLFVIDGIPVVSGSNETSTSTGTLGILSSINQNDIENITVLKDAGATALYGARGANGVIIITTKKGKQGKPSINFSAQYGSVDRAVEGPRMLNSAQWNELYYESLVNAGFAADAAEAEQLYPSGWDGVTDTDWRDVVSNKNANTESYDISITGGNEKTTYYTSLGYMSQDGVNLGTNYERISGKVSFSQQFTDKLKVSNSLTPSFVTQNGQLEGSAYFSNPDAAYLFTWPIDKPRNDDGTPNLDLGTSTYNPLYVYKNDINLREQTRVFDALDLSYEITDALTLTSVVGLDFLLTEELYFDNKNYGDGASNGGRSLMYNNRNFNWSWKNILDYSLTLNESHKVDFKLVYEAQKNNFKSVGTSGVGFAADGLYYPNSVGTIDFGTGYINDWSINSILGLVNYTFKGNLFLDATIRREGSSRFAAGNRWGTFYSVGASWVFSDEAFMSGVTWLNTSKLRASYGKTGNAGIPINEYQATLSYQNSYNGVAGSQPGQFGNMFLTWENQNSFNVALDFGLMERFSGTVEYFNRTTYDLLLDVPLSRTTGFESQRQNFGEMVNSGFEFTLNADIIKEGAFKWNIGVNYTMLENEVTKLPVDATGEEIGITTATRKVTAGQPAYVWNMRTWAGVDTQTGNPLWYVDGQSGETTSTYADAGLSFQGASATPTSYGGVNTRIEFKGLFASASLYVSGGNKVFDQWAGYTQSDGRFTYNVSSGYASLYDRWQQPGDVAANPINVYGNTSNSSATSTRRLYDGGFMRLRNVTVGYDLPRSLISQIRLNNASIYVMGTNLWTRATDETLQFDPEVKSDGFFDLNAPPLKTMVFGVRLGF